MKTNNLYIKLLSLVLAGSFLASCSSNDNRYIEIDNSYLQKANKNSQINYIPNVEVITKDDKLLNLIKSSDDKQFNVTDANFAVLKLYIDTELVADQLEKPKVKLVGILKKDERNYNYKISYKLVDGVGKTITQGSAIGITDEPTESVAFAPAKANKSAIEDAAKEVITKLNKQVADLLIDFKIVSVSADSVYISVNDDIKLLNNEIFLVNELPNTALNFSQLITNGKTTLGELKVITGEFPKPGMTVNLQK
jgi:hypothetical protein